MPWDARKIGDYELHRRRLFIACIGLICAATGFFLAVDGLAERSSVLRELSLVSGLILLTYFASLGLRELRQMKAARHKR